MVSCKALLVILVLAASAAADSTPEAASSDVLPLLTPQFWSDLRDSFYDGLENVRAGTATVMKQILMYAIEGVFGEYTACVPGTDVCFNKDNYYQYIIDFLIAASQNDNGVAMQQWYLIGTGLNEVTAGAARVGPGPSTVTRMGFELVKETCEAMSAKIEAGTLERRNELGMQYLAPNTWPERPGGIPTIGLGQSNENHAFFRPLIANELDKGLDEQAPCDGSTCWNTEWLEHRAEAFFRGRHSLGSHDVKWYVAQILHKVHLNIDLNEAKARKFAVYHYQMLILIPLIDGVMNSPLANEILDRDRILAEKRQYLNEYKAAIRAKYAGADWISDEERVELLASVNLDSLTFASGLSVPNVIAVVMGLTHMAEHIKPASLRGGVAADEEWVLWETLRKQAPVSGVPFWERTREGGPLTRVIPNVAQALMDASVFPEPLEFKNRGLSFYHEKMGATSGTNAGMGWAGPAIAADKDTANPHSHNCPAQDLSFKMMQTFLRAFVSHGPWKAVNAGDITINANGISSFNLKKMWGRCPAPGRV